MQDTLLIAFYYHPVNTSGVQRAGRLVKYLPEYGHRMRVVTSSAGGVRPDLTNVAYVPAPGAPSPGLALQTRAARLIQRVLPYNEQLPWVPHAVAAGASLIERHGISSILSTSPPVGSHYTAYLLKKRFPKLTWVADLRDPLLGSPGRTRKWAEPYDRAIQGAFFRNASAIVTVTEAMAQGWRELYPEMASKINVIFNGFDPEEGFGPRPVADDGCKVLAHVGFVYRLRRPTAIVESLDRLTSAGRLDPKSVRLRLTGELDGPDDFRALPAVRSLLEKGCLQLELKTVPRAQAMSIVAASHALLLLDIATSQGAGYTIPAKLFEYILTGRTILAATAHNSPAEQILRRSGVRHFLIAPDEAPESADEKVMGVFHAPSEPGSPSPWFLETFDGRRQAGAFARLLENPR